METLLPHCKISLQSKYLVTSPLTEAPELLCPSPAPPSWNGEKGKIVDINSEGRGPWGHASHFLVEL